MNPDDEAANDARPKAADALAKLPSLKETPANAAKAQEKIAREVGDSEKVLLGWLARGDDGWECRSATTSRDGDFVLQVLTREQNASVLWKEIGTLKFRKFTFASESPYLILEGRLVFGQKIKGP